MKLMTLRSNDFVPYFDVNPYHSADSKNLRVSETNNCAYRTLRAADVAGLEIGWGMLFTNYNGRWNPIESNPLQHHGFGIDCPFHIWNKQDNFLYDSPFQAKNSGWGFSEIGSEVMVFSANHLQKKMNYHTPKSEQQVLNELKKAQYQAKMYGVKNLYVEGFSWNPWTGAFHTDKIIKENLLLAKETNRKYFSENLV
jgi:hypothetical protein